MWGMKFCDDVFMGCDILWQSVKKGVKNIPKGVTSLMDDPLWIPYVVKSEIMRKFVTV